MSKISLSPDVAGTGIFTIASPGTSTNRTLTLPDDTGTIVTNSGNQAGSFTTIGATGDVTIADKIVHSGDTNTAIRFPAADNVAIETGGVERVDFSNSDVVFNESGADVDFRVEGDTDANLLFVDASADKVGIGTGSPGVKLSVTTATAPSDLGGTSAFYVATNNPSAASPVGIFGSDDNVGGPTINGFKSRGTLASPTVANTDDSLFGVGGYAWDTTSTTGYKLGATINFRRASGSGGVRAPGYIQFNTSSDASTFTERMRLDSSGNLLVGKTIASSSTAGFQADPEGTIAATRSAELVFIANRLTDDGTLVSFRQASTEEGTISVSGNTVSYNPFLGSHSGALADWSKPEIKIGTVMDTIDELLEYKVVVIDVQEEVPAKEAVLDEEGNEVEPAQEATTQTVQKRISYNGNGAVGSNATVEYEGQEYTGTIEHERKEPLSFNKHLKVKVNDTTASKAVFGVFVGWNNDSNNDGGVYNDMLVGAVGNYVIRMAAGQEPQIGDLVEADGNGCAVVQDDDIIRTKTIAKVTSTIKQVTYDDGSFLVTCVLYCG